MTSIHLEEKNIGHTMNAADPVTALKWVYQQLGYASSFNANSSNPNLDGVQYIYN